MAWCVGAAHRVEPPPPSVILARFRVNKRSSPLTQTAFNPFQPVVTVILSWLVQGVVRSSSPTLHQAWLYVPTTLCTPLQVPSMYYYIGGAGVIVGLFSLTLTQYYERSRSLQSLSDSRLDIQDEHGRKSTASGDVALVLAGTEAEDSTQEALLPRQVLSK